MISKFRFLISVWDKLKREIQYLVTSFYTFYELVTKIYLFNFQSLSYDYYN